ncbi:GntR family transcriptional regulator [Paenibacillus sp. TRM 82003]|nr:GntR family transcriptional regulator [Paenibacillus sp. TRM 82003]
MRFQTIVGGSLMIKNFVLQADPDFTYSINQQIKEQLKWLIGLGDIRPGELLPPAQRLAEQLGVNRNTVTLVYTQLRDEGLVAIRKGRGTQVVDGPAAARLRESRSKTYALLSAVTDEAAARGSDLTEFAVSTFAFVQLYRCQDARKKKILFIECREHDYPFYRNQIEQSTKGEVVTLFLEDVAENPRILEDVASRSDLAVTTLNHVDEVRKLLSAASLRLVTVGAAVDVPVLLEIARLEAGSRVAFVCLGNRGGRWMADKVNAAGIRQIESIVADITDKEKLLNHIRRSNRVYASSAVFEEIHSLAPDKISLFPMVLESGSEELLKEVSQCLLHSI